MNGKGSHVASIFNWIMTKVKPRRSPSTAVQFAPVDLAPGMVETGERSLGLRSESYLYYRVSEATPHGYHGTRTRVYSSRLWPRFSGRQVELFAELLAARDGAPPNMSLPAGDLDELVTLVARLDSYDLADRHGCDAHYWVPFLLDRSDLTEDHLLRLLNIRIDEGPAVARRIELAHQFLKHPATTAKVVARIMRLAVFDHSNDQDRLGKLRAQAARREVLNLADCRPDGAAMLQLYYVFEPEHRRTHWLRLVDRLVDGGPNAFEIFSVLYTDRGFDPRAKVSVDELAEVVELAVLTARPELASRTTR
jgi:hypothetical protein